MAEPIIRCTFMGATLRTQATVVRGQPLFFVDVLWPDDADHETPDVTIGWNPQHTKFGVYVDGVCVWPIGEPEPAPDEPPDPEDILTDLDTTGD